jgi:hypothetical protein
MLDYTRENTFSAVHHILYKPFARRADFVVRIVTLVFNHVALSTVVHDLWPIEKIAKGILPLKQMVQFSQSS